MNTISIKLVGLCALVPALAFAGKLRIEGKSSTSTEEVKVNNFNVDGSTGALTIMGFGHGICIIPSVTLGKIDPAALGKNLLEDDQMIISCKIEREKNPGNNQANSFFLQSELPDAKKDKSF